MIKKLLIIIIIFFILKNGLMENFNILNELKFNNLYLDLEDKVRVDLTTPKIHYLSPIRSKYLYNYTLNLNFINSIISKNPIVISKAKLIDYLNYICFITDYNIHDAIIEKINNFLIDFLHSDTRIGGNTTLGVYYNLLLNLVKKQFKNNFLKNLNYEIDLIKNTIILNLIIDNIFSYTNINSNKNIKDTIIDLLLEKKWLKIESKKDYDDLDILFEGLNETLINYINSHYDTKYDNVLNLSIYKINNLYYSGDIMNFEFNIDLFCK